MAIKTGGINHPALFGLSYDKTVDFYTRVLGMRLVLEQPNLDDPTSIHLFFETGPGQFIAYFVPKPDNEIQGRVQTGALNHIALNLQGSLDEAMQTLDAEGIVYSGPVDRGYERSIYFRDPNGVTVELMIWLTPKPDEIDEGDLILAAQARRLARGAYAIEDEDVKAVLADFQPSA
ncbi:MAG: VOC family protein [Dehalococcoidia bacterium]|nr:VOC family protein [Dehalococcoidia bacterium]